MVERIFLDAAEWFETLPTAYVGSSALITDEAGRVLLVKPNYRDHWTLPGGVVEQDESPHDGGTREVLEEIGLPLRLEALLVIDWTPPVGVRPRPFVNFVFDGGVLDDPATITLQAEELDDFLFVEPGDVASYLPPFIARRIPAAIAARAKDQTVYLPMWRGR